VDIFFLTTFLDSFKILETNKAVDIKIDGAIQKPPPKWGFLRRKAILRAN